MIRLHQTIPITSTLLASWLGMQAIHESGHALCALATGGQVKQIVLNPLTLSRTDLAQNPHPLPVVWAGPLFGSLFPLALYGIASTLKLPSSFVFRFFAGFCLIANGAYISIGSLRRIGDCGVMLQHGSQIWQLWLFGLLTIPTGFLLWNHQGKNFGLGPTNGIVNLRVTYATLLALLLLLTLGFTVGG